MWLSETTVDFGQTFNINIGTWIATHLGSILAPSLTRSYHTCILHFILFSKSGLTLIDLGKYHFPQCSCSLHCTTSYLAHVGSKDNKLYFPCQSGILIFFLFRLF